MPAYRDYLPRQRFLPTVSIASDSDQIAFVDDSESGQFNLAVRRISTNDTRRLTRYVDSTVRDVAWHRSGQWLLFVADEMGNEVAQLFRVGAEGGEPIKLTNSPEVRYALALGDPFSPDGSLVAYCGNERNPADQDVLVLDIRTGDSRRLDVGSGRVFPGYWSPDGAWLTVTEWRTTNSDHLVYVVPTGGGPPKLLTAREDVATYWLGPWLPDGDGFLVLTNAGRQFTGLAKMDAKTGQLSWIDAPEWDVEEVALSADGRVLVWNVNVDGYSQLRARNLATGEDIATRDLRGPATGLTISPDGQCVVLRISTPTQPWNLAVIGLDLGELRWLSDARPAAVDPGTFIEPTLIRYPTRDGQLVPGYLYRPLHKEPAGVLLMIHGGPAWQERPGYQCDGFYQYLAGHGIGVLAPNVRGSLGYGRAYSDQVNRDWGGGDLLDMADAVDFLRGLGWVDPARIAVMGSSYGGFAVLSCLSRLPELDWAAGVDICGPSNLVTLAKAAPPTWKSLVAAVIGDPDADAQRLMDRSPVTHADQIRAPLFVIQGANDPRVPKDESDQIVARLRERGLDVRYEVFPDEGHGFIRRDNQEKAYSDAGEFLIKHLTSRRLAEST